MTDGSTASRRNNRVLITGASGFIGSQLAQMAAQAGYEVCATAMANNDLERGRIRRLEAAGVKVSLAPLQDSSALARTLQGQQVVIHLAAAQHEANVPDSYFDQVNVEGTRMLLEASHAAGIQRFVFGSTIGVYGASRDGALDENSTPNPVNAYGRSKLAAEEVVRAFNGRLETTIVRISETYGPEDFRLLKLFKAIDRGMFMMIGSGLNRHQLIDVDDLNRGLLVAAEHPGAPGHTFVIAGHEALTTREMVEHIAVALGRRPPALRVPLWPFLLAAIALETTLKPLGIQPPLHRRRLDFFTKSFLFSTAKAEAVLGFKPAVRFAEGARRAAAWYRQQGYLASKPAV